MSFYRVEPLAGVWEDPTPASQRRSRYTFKATYPQTEQLLRRELEHLDPHRSWEQTDVVLQIACQPSDLRLDGTLRANARQPAHPGVRISFTTAKHGALSYATDVCELWQHNVRSLALGLEALRAVDRFGISTRGQQYDGFKALPAGRAMPASHMTRTEAIETLARLVDPAIAVELQRHPASATPAALKSLHRDARVRSHPDRHGGDQTLWDQVEQAARVLGVTA